MTQQEIFNTVVEHLLTQNVRSLDGEICMYRSKEGLKCAIGCLIPDDEYSVELEGYQVSVIQSGLYKSLLSKKTLDMFQNNLTLLKHLQDIHDIIDPKCWDTRLKATALKFNLNCPEILRKRLNLQTGAAGL